MSMSFFYGAPPPRQNYVEVPDEAPKPIMWKSLGHPLQGYEAHYGLETFNGELDPDSEADLRQEVGVMAELYHKRNELTDGLTLARQVGRPLIVRFVQCYCGQHPANPRN